MVTYIPFRMCIGVDLAFNETLHAWFVPPLSKQNVTNVARQILILTHVPNARLGY